MVNWNDPDVISTCISVANNVDLFVLGLYSWYFCATLHKVEFPLLARKLEWKWVFLYYLGSRWASLASQVASVVLKVQFANPSDLVIVAIFGSLASVCASGNLLMRTIAIWRENRIIIWTLAVMAGVHVVLLIIAALLPYLNAKGPSAAPGLDSPKVVRGSVLPFFIYTSALDFIIMILTIVGLLRHKGARGTSLWHRLYRQGVLFFVATSLVNLPLVVLMSMAFSTCLAGFLSSPSLAVTVIASCTAVTSLLDLGTKTENGSPSGDVVEETQSSNRLSTVQLSMSMFHQTANKGAADCTVKSPSAVAGGQSAA